MFDGHDWPEDYHFENGNYSGICVKCGITFRGHKGRPLCRRCYTLASTINDMRWHLSESEDEHENHQFHTDKAGKRENEIYGLFRTLREERDQVEADYRSLRAELATIFGPVKPHHGMSWNASMLARIAEVLAKKEE